MNNNKIKFFPIKHFYPNFLKHLELAPESKLLSIYHQDCGLWYSEFVEKINYAIENHKYLPVYRISHGEFIMALGYKLHKKASVIEILKFTYLKMLRVLGIIPIFYSGSKDNSYEKFSKEDIAKAKEIYLEGLHEVADKGFLAMTFYLSKGFEAYIDPYRNWLEKNSIELSRENYYSFYMLYVMLTGPDSNKLLKGRKVAAVSSFTKAKKEGVINALQEIGVEQYFLYSVSPSKAMFNTIDLAMFPYRPDVILVAAGVGSANIILQLKPLQTVILDVGFALDALAFPEKRWNRPFCVDDKYFDRDQVKFLPKECIMHSG